jgi:hypothetical protein
MDKRRATGSLQNQPNSLQTTMCGLRVCMCVCVCVFVCVCACFQSTSSNAAAVMLAACLLRARSPACCSFARSLVRHRRRRSSSSPLPVTRSGGEGEIFGTKNFRSRTPDLNTIFTNIIITLLDKQL